ncbi:c-type cytochrome biogenesis protein CcmI [Pasteurellaceae bacterium HPA106]|uniref:c-type cytochrome biogenesis protein CcmI n=1 Tax=Spirabiliibacterium pneumoniae TaxID=221400 RepID=UPI001AAE07DD|nr:c-type cytochrome biogenesis protein CcmI [Spirabiliibacterium pneumoniae]MBE2897195.1 c-type cytochrome biogenesis protein CcmI [Spirabiliibacterium pneumoniae]
MTLWLLILGLTVIVASIAFYPLLVRTHNRTFTRQHALNRAFYYHSLDEVQQQQAEGVLDNSAQAQQELQQRLLTDIPEHESAVAPTRIKRGGIWFISATLALVSIALAAYFSVGSWRAQQQLDHAQAQLPALYQRLDEEQSKPLNMNELQQLTIGLRTHLQQDPNDAKGWWLLGQIGMNTNNGQLAMESYKRAFNLDPANLNYKVSYARVLLFSQDERDNVQGEVLLRQVIKQDHTNTQALSLLAFNAYEKENYTMALTAWKMMLKLLPNDDSRIALIQRSIEQAQQALKKQQSAVPSQEKPNE